MECQHRASRVFTGLLLLAACLCSAQTESAVRDGLLVVAVGPASEAEAAGIEPGDRLLHWRRGDNGPWAPLTTPYDLTWQETVCGSGCTLEVRGERDGNPQDWRLRAGDWRITALPFAYGKPGIGADMLSRDQLEGLAATASDAGVAAWVRARLIIAAAVEERWAAVSQEAALLDRIPNASYRLMAYADAVSTLARSASHDALRPLLDAGIALTRADTATVPVRLRTQLQLGEFMSRRGQLDEAVRLLTQAEKLTRQEALDSPFVAELSTLRANVATMQGDLATARTALLAALATLDGIAGETGYTRFWALRSLGIVTTMAGHLDEAERHSTAALSIVQRTRDTGAEARLLNNLGILFVRRGDMARAEYYYQRAMRLNESLGSWLSYAYNLANLGDIAIARNDNERAESLFQAARETILEQSPDSTDAAQVTTMLANAQFVLGKLDEASQNYAWAMQVYERVAPGSLDLAAVRIGLGDVWLERGDTHQALREFNAALAIRRGQVPGSVEHAEALNYLARALAAAGEIESARGHYLNARDILVSLAPESKEHAGTLFALARLAERSGDIDAALQYYAESVAAAEGQTEQLGGADDSRTAFAAEYARLFDRYIRLLLSLDRHQDAFDAFERYQARLLVTMLAERESSIRFSLPANILAERRRIEQAYADARYELMVLTEEGADATLIAAAKQQVVEREVARNALTQRLRAVAEGFAQLRYPQSLSLADAQAALDPGTLALMYRIGSERSMLFAVARDRFDVVDLPLAADELRDLVRRFRLLIDLGRLGEPPDAALIGVARDLYAAVIAPVDVLADYERLLIVADGPLHSLPFGALVEPGATTSAPRYLIESLPVHRTLSLTLYDQLRRARERATARPRLAAFANANATTREPDAQSYVAAVFASARELGPLPWAADEVNELAEIYGDALSIASSAGATEAEFVRQAGEADIVHVAAHAIVDERTPLDSALVFQRGRDGDTGDDGLLQAWEIFDRLRLDAALVVLSSCRSGFGRETASEGLLGLQRAFLYAGTRAVVSSLWNVADRSTRDLMVAFHRELQAGVPIDKALREAQLALLRGSPVSEDMGLLQRIFGSEPAPQNYRHPYHWAGFELSGDYRAVTP